MKNHQKVDDRKDFHNSSWLQPKTHLEETYFNFLNVALLSKRLHLIALWMLIIIKRVFCSYFSAEENVKSFSKTHFLSHSLYFPILLQIIHRMSNINHFPSFLIWGSLIKAYATMYSYFSTLTVVKLVLLINFHFSGTLLQYPIFLLTLDEFIANNKQT